MAIQKFEDIIAWQKAKQVTLMIYKKFKSNKDYGFKDQIQRASISIMNNIAEGFDRRTDKEFIQYLYIAKGSCSEVKSMLYVAVELNYITHEIQKQLNILLIDIAKIIYGFINSIKI